MEALTRSQRKDSMLAMGLALGLHHRRRNLPKHFTKRGYGLYGYAPRAGDPGNTRKSFRQSYQGRKLRLFGHTLPLVFRGDLRRQTLYGLKRVSASGTSERLTIDIHLPIGANRKNPRSRAHPLRELQAVNGAELVELERFAGEELERQWRRRGAAGSAGVNISTTGGGPGGISAAG